jgi:hypothetical protein
VEEASQHQDVLPNWVDGNPQQVVAPQDVHAIMESPIGLSMTLIINKMLNQQWM